MKPIIYTLSDCPFCKEIKKELLLQKIDYEERDTEDERFIDEYQMILRETDNNMIPVLRKGNLVYLADEDFSDVKTFMELIKSL